MMRTVKKPIIKYVYVEPKTAQEKEEQERILAAVYDDIFKRAVLRIKEKRGNSQSKKNTR